MQLLNPPVVSKVDHPSWAADSIDTNERACLKSAFGACLHGECSHSLTARNLSLLEQYKQEELIEHDRTNPC